MRPRLLLLCGLLLGLPGALAAGPPMTTFHHEVMATRFELRLPPVDAADAAAAAVFAIFDDVDARMSEWKSSSPLSAVNREAGVSPVKVPDDVRAVVRRGIEVGQLSEGAFDITWAALWGLWDFRAAEPALPAAADVVARAGLVDFTEVTVDDAAGTVFLQRVDMKLGLGGIAKGWALDRAAAELDGRGIDRYLLSGGGQVLARGAFRVGIRDPRGEPDDFFAVLDVTDTSISTSGDYERFFVVDGVRYHHLLDPRSGLPARGLRSVTAVCADATLADAMSTAIFVLGRERGLALAEVTAGLEAVLVDDAGGLHLTSGMASRLEVVHPPLRQ